MNIVIIGAGTVGRHIASLLSKENHNIILVDKDAKKLQEAAANMDVAIRQGSGADWQLLDDLLEYDPDLIIALAGNDETNLVTCSIAKELGYPRTIARVRNVRYLNRVRLDFERMFDVDSFINPELLVAREIFNYVISPGSLYLESFAHGALLMRIIAIPEKWKSPTTLIRELDFPDNMIVGLIYRDNLKKSQSKELGKEVERNLIFPHGNDHIFPGDEVAFIGEADTIADVHQMFGIAAKRVKSVTIIGGSITAINLAQLLVKHEIDVRIIERDYETCVKLAERLPHCTISHHDGTDLNFLVSEKIGKSDLLVACTSKDDTNLAIALLGKEIGCEDVFILLSNTSYIPMIKKLGFGYTVSPYISAGNHIMSQILSGKVNSLVALYDNQAEIMEVNVSIEAKVVGIPLSQLGPYLPKDFLIAMIQNRGRIMIAHGNRVISPGDTVIVVTSPKHVSELEKFF